MKRSKIKGFTKIDNLCGTHLFLSFLCLPTFLLFVVSFSSSSVSISVTKQLLGPLIFLSSQSVRVGVGMLRRRRLTPSRWWQVVSRGQWGPVAVGWDLAHGWRQGAAVSRGPSVCGFCVGLLIAAHALEVAVVVLLTPVSQHMDRQPPLLVHPYSPSLFPSHHSSSPLPL